MTGNASNVQACIKNKTGRRLLGCLGHKINLIVRAGTHMVHRVVHLIGKGKNIVRFIKRRAVAYEKLKENED